MTSLISQYPRVVSGMRVTGKLHLGHYHGVLKSWLTLQHEYDCFFFAADWHALTTEYEEPHTISSNTWEMIIDWLAVGVNPNAAKLFIQSRIPEHAELHLLLSMITPLSWLERVPSFKEQQEKLKEKDLATYGFLGYPLLQSADVLIYRANLVPVGEDQLPHLELIREVARRFNYLYGKDPDFITKVEAALQKLGKKNAKLYRKLLKDYQEQGNLEALETGKAILGDHPNLSIGDRERLGGYLEGGGRIILPEPQPLLSQISKFPGLDGQKMSKSYHNTIALGEDPDLIAKKIAKMPTDPARVRRTDPGEPEKCPVWQFHKIYSNEATQQWVLEGCRGATIGCLECKQPIIEAIQQEQAPIRQRALELKDDMHLVRNIVNEGCEAARDEARRTLAEVKQAMGLSKE